MSNFCMARQAFMPLKETLRHIATCNKKYMHTVTSVLKNSHLTQKENSRSQLHSAMTVVLGIKVFQIAPLAKLASLVQ